MAFPEYIAGTPGNAVAYTALAGGQGVAAYLDATSVWELSVTLEIATTGAAVPSPPPSWSTYRASGAPIALAAAAAAGSTSLSVASAPGIRVGDSVCLWHPAAPAVGELVTVAAISGSGPVTLTIAGAGTGGGTAHAYAIGDLVVAYSQTPLRTDTPVGPGGTFIVGGDYSVSLALPTGGWVIATANPAGGHLYTAAATYDSLVAWI